jgi:predicted enzyme related to lactoylglutathione lyase
VAELKSRGVTFVLEPTDTGVCHFARFLDSEGNHLVLHRKH